MLFQTRLKCLRQICRPTVLAAVLVACLPVSTARAQVVPSAIGPGRSLWVGGEYSNIQAGFPYQSSQRLSGPGVFADYHLTGHIAVEAEARFLRFNSFYGETEDNYLAGARYVVLRFGKFEPFAQGLVGIGKIQFPFNIGSGNYLAVAPGGGAIYRLSRKWSVRGEYEYQFWPNSPNIANEPAHEITPNGFHVGIAYRVLR